MSDGHPGVLVWQDGHAVLSAASSQHARAAQRLSQVDGQTRAAT